MAKKINKFISKCKFTFVDLIQNDFENEKVILKIYHELIKVNNNNHLLEQSFVQHTFLTTTLAKALFPTKKIIY